MTWNVKGSEGLQPTDRLSIERDWPLGWDIEAYEKDGDKTVRLVNRHNTAHEVIFSHSSESGTVDVGAYEFGVPHSSVSISDEGMRFIFDHLGIGAETGATSAPAEQA